MEYRSLKQQVPRQPGDPPPPSWNAAFGWFLAFAVAVMIGCIAVGISTHA
jgi:hypothetical protein